MGLWWSLRLQNTPLATQQAFPKELHQSTPVKNTRPVAIAAPGQAQQSRVDGVRQSRSAEPARCLVPNMGTAQPGTSGSVKVSRAPSTPAASSAFRTRSAVGVLLPCNV